MVFLSNRQTFWTKSGLGDFRDFGEGTIMTNEEEGGVLLYNHNKLFRLKSEIIQEKDPSSFDTLSSGRSANISVSLR